MGEIAVLGAGPAGLTAAHVLARRGRSGIVFEAQDSVGGIAKTVRRNGCGFDLGGHRFFTKLAPIERLWRDLLGDDLLTRPRLSRIYYRGEFLAYPLRTEEVIGRLGLGEALRCIVSCVWGRLRRRGQPETFEDWVTGRFGRRLYETFFHSYTEKVWGIPGSEIRSEWAAQRIRNFSLHEAMRTALGLSKREIPTLMDEFLYPRLGSGQMWQALAERVEAGGVPIRLNEPCVSVRHRRGRVESIVVQAEGCEVEHAVDGVLSSIPLGELALALSPPAPPEALAAARGLRYRDLCVVALVIEGPEPFPDTWIYLHDPGTRAARVQNFRAWSEDLVPPGTTCLGVEYFCFAGDELWELPDARAVELATDELARIGLIDPGKVVDGTKVRVAKAYPMYDSTYRQATSVLRAHLEGFSNLQTFGRNGLHRYNNQDHSMWTAILAVLNLLDGASHDVWSVNTGAVYLEEGGLVDRLLNLDLVG